jgi:tetratricopeptide (TPR) repeat protein
MTLNNLAVLCRANERFVEAEHLYREVIAIRRKLTGDQPMTYASDLAVTLNNLAIFYLNTGRVAEALRSYEEALAIFREMADANPEAFLAKVAVTLHNLAELNFKIQRVEDAKSLSEEAQRILQPFWERNPSVHGDALAQIAILRSMVAASDKGKSEAACLFARQAFASACDPVIKRNAEGLIREFGPSSSG